MNKLYLLLLSSLPLQLITGFLIHLIGDYITQNDWMAVNKTKHSKPALIHSTLYSLPFLFFISIKYFLIIYITHYLIDRYRLAVYWIKLMNWNWSSINFGFSQEKPLYISIWLLIIIDNSFHLLINSLCISLSFIN